MRRPRSLVLIPFALLAACAAPRDIAQTVDGVTRSRSGDTTIIVTSRDGAWGPVHDAVEVLRVGETSKETTFGQIQTLVATAGGGVLLFDTRSPDGKVIRQFSAEGAFVRNIGRAGSGPGEYASDMVRFAEGADGTILVREVFRGVSRFAADGRFLGALARDMRHTSHEIFAASDGSIYLRGSARPVRAGPTVTSAGFASVLRYDTTGRLLDSIVAGPSWIAGGAPPSPFPQPTPTETWFPLADGRVIVGRTDKVGFLLTDPSGRTAPLIAELAVAPIVYTREEREELQAVQDWMQANFGLVEGGRVVVEGPKAVVVPANKMASQGIQADISGRIWIAKTTPSVKVEPFVAAASDGKSVSKSYAEQERVFVAFQLDGTFLGEVRFPVRAWHIAFVGDFAWAVTHNDDGVPLLVKYRLR